MPRSDDDAIATQRTERYFAVKAGQNGLLDVARKTYTEARRVGSRHARIQPLMTPLPQVIDDVQALVAQYTTQYMMDGLRLKNNSKRGYFLTLPLS